MHKKRWSIKYIVSLSMCLACLIVLGILSALMQFDKIVVQFTTGVYVVLIWLMPGSGMLFVGCVYGAILDAINNSLITIPMTLLIQCLIFIIVKLPTKTPFIHLHFFIACLLVFLYLPYQWLVTWHSTNIPTKMSLLTIEAIVDAIQFATSFVICEILYLILVKTKLNLKIVKIF